MRDFLFCNYSARVRSELHSHATRLHELHTDAETLRANESQISNHLRETVHENERLKKELTNTQKVTGEFRKECESLVADYQGAAKKIEQLEEERDRYRDQTNMGMRELAQRAERVKSLEGERQSLQDQLMHMDMQVSVCVCVCVCVFVYCVKIMRKNAGLGRLLSASPGRQPSVHVVLAYGRHSSQPHLCVQVAVVALY